MIKWYQRQKWFMQIAISTCIGTWVLVGCTWAILLVIQYDILQYALLAIPLIGIGLMVHFILMQF